VKARAGWIVAVVGVAAILSIPLVFFASLRSFRSMVEEEYRTGVRVSTDGDSAIIPAMGITIAWSVLLLTVGAATGVVLLVRSARRRRRVD
jgi:hypothetical protein